MYMGFKSDEVSNIKYRINYILFIGWPRRNITIVLGIFNRRYAQIFGPFATF